MARTKVPEYPKISASELVNTQQAAEILGLSPITLSSWRRNLNESLPYYIYGRRVKYRRQDLDDFVSAKRITP